MLLDRLFGGEAYVYTVEELNQRKVLPLPSVSDFVCNHIGLSRDDSVPVYITRPRSTFISRLLDTSTFESKSKEWLSSFCSCPRPQDSLNSSGGRELRYSKVINGYRFDFKEVVRRDLTMTIKEPRAKKLLFSVSSDLISLEVEVTSTLYKRDMLNSFGAPYEESYGNYRKQCLIYTFKECFDKDSTELDNAIKAHLELETADFHAKGLVSVPCGLEELNALKESIGTMRTLYEGGILSYADFTFFSAILRAERLVPDYELSSGDVFCIQGIIKNIKLSECKVSLNAVLVEQLKVTFL